MLAVQTIVAVYVVNIGYGFEGTFTQLGDFKFVSAALGAENGERKAPAGGGNCLAGIWLGKLPVPLPKHYVLGMDLQRRDFESYGSPSYLAGQFQEKGWWYYYLYALAIKVPLGTWLLVLLAAVAPIAVSARRQRASERGTVPFCSAEPAKLGQSPALCRRIPSADRNAARRVAR